MIDLFCGTGGFAQGFINSPGNLEVIYANDLDQDATETAKANHPNCLVDRGDIRKIKPSEVASRIGTNRVDVVVGGPPCQGFSSLRPGRSANAHDDRNNLYMRFADFVNFFQPKVVVLENVVGLVTHNHGTTLIRVLEKFRSIGYSVDWRILNAAAYGVPQKRERFIMIGTRGIDAVRFPSTTHYFEGRVIGHRDRSRLMPLNPANPRAPTVVDAIGDLPALARSEEATAYDSAPFTDYQRDRRNSCNKLTLHRAANHSDKMLEVIKHSGANIRCIPSHLITSGFSSSYSRLDANQPSTTITVKFQSPASNKCIHPSQNRTLTPREAARIQSFDDDFIFKGPLTKISSQIGNAVPPLLGRAIAGAVDEMLQDTWGI